MRSGLGFFFGVLVVVALAVATASKPDAGPEKKVGFRPGQVWLDTDGKPIQAHGGGILYKDEIYYCYGEDMSLSGNIDYNKIGMSCYSSRDLYHWKREGVALSKESVPEQFRDSGICERPKVLYNARTRNHVKWVHLDDTECTIETAGVATSETPTRPFRFLGQSRPIRCKVPDPPALDARWPKLHQDELGSVFADMNLFLDEDGKAYVVYASDGDWTMYVSRLNQEFTGVETPVVEGKTWARILVHEHREAPAPFKYKGKYYLITSACTGWAPNAAGYAVASNILGSWTDKGNPAIDPEADTTFHSQSTFVLKAPGRPANCFIYLADRWRADNL